MTLHNVNTDSTSHYFNEYGNGAKLVAQHSSLDFIWLKILDENNILYRWSPFYNDKQHNIYKNHNSSK